ncbi:MAG: mandelate racemase, partial [Planctomycetota bacterium]
MAAPRVRVLETSVFWRPVRTRLPFRYGRAVLTEAPVAHLRLRVHVEGRPAAGTSGALLPPLWFDKSPGRTHEDDIRALLRSLREAATAYREAGA